jgi:hypothetical protein
MQFSTSIRRYDRLGKSSIVQETDVPSRHSEFGDEVKVAWEINYDISVLVEQELTIQANSLSAPFGL